MTKDRSVSLWLSKEESVAEEGRVVRDQTRPDLVD